MMAFKATRRNLLVGLAGAPVLATACATPSKPRASAGPRLSGPKADFLGPAEGTIRLSSNENPYGPSKSALKMVEYGGEQGAYYAGRAEAKLKDMIAERHGLTRQNIVLSAGSAEVLRAAALLYGMQGPIVTPRLFFDPTVTYAERLGVTQIDRCPLQADMGIDLAAMEARVTSATGMVQICNPNNPTGLSLNAAQLKPAVRRMSKLAPVVVDEAYIELMSDPEVNGCVDLVRAGHNVIVARTFSKIYGMAGLRVGYAITTEEIASKLQPAVMSWMSGTGVAAAIGCYNDEAFLNYSRSKIFEAREMIETTVDDLGLDRKASDTNFVYFNPGIPANELRDRMKAEGIMIRPQYMDYDNWSRVSVGRISDVQIFCETLLRLLNA